MIHRPIHANKRGFTLIELLVVILILGILAAIALPQYLSSIASSNKRTCQTNMTTIANAMQAFRTNNYNHQYPATLSALIVGPTATSGGTATPDLTAIPKCPEDAGTGIAPADAQGYLLVVGQDANSNNVGPITITCQADTAHGAWNNGNLTSP